MLSDITNELIKSIYLELKKKKNKQRLEVIISEISSLLFKTLHPYIIGVLVMLIILFIMNVMQFYFYLTFRQSNLDYSKLHMINN
jgi:flagellar biosynthesis protein FlhB